mmetsp:Transcript_41275/g.66404  ORF Transcript_41275/g.66404 Transcript_41275/m.66404 type:complete len:112 (+) Transcript_41275:37-372(+)
MVEAGGPSAAATGETGGGKSSEKKDNGAASCYRYAWQSCPLGGGRSLSGSETSAHVVSPIDHHYSSCSAGLKHLYESAVQLLKEVAHAAMCSQRGEDLLHFCEDWLPPGFV